VWTFISITVYLATTAKMVSQNCFVLDGLDMKSIPVACKLTWPDVSDRKVQVTRAPSPSDAPSTANTSQVSASEPAANRMIGDGVAQPKLPSFDQLLLVLAGVVQGSYLAGRVLSTRNPPQIDGAYSNVEISGTTSVRLVGVFSGITSIVVADKQCYNFMLEVTDNSGVKFLLNFGDPGVIDSGKTDTALNAKVSSIEATSSLIKLGNLAPPSQEYTFRISIDGVWSESKTYRI
jgi:hypothetical protein